MRFAVDTGGTFTDLLVEDAAGTLRMFKAPTTPADPIRGVIDALQVAASELGRSLQSLLADGETFIYGTTHAINAIITGNTARTAFLTTEGHPDVLVLREGGRAEPFNYTVPYPEPYVPRSLTWEVPGRLRPDGSEFAPFDDAACRRVIGEMKARDVQAVAVCLLWSIVNPAHELRVASLLEAALPGVPYTLSHQLNPTLREYRRASVRLHRRLAQADDGRVHGGADGAVAGRGLRRAGAGGDVAGRRDGCVRRRAGADPSDQLRAVDGTGLRPTLRGAGRGQRHRHDRRYRRHHLRR